MIILYTGETHLTFHCSWIDDAGNPVNLRNPDLSNAVLSVRWHTDTKGATSHLGAGTFTPISMASGRFDYAIDAGDVSTADKWRVQFKAVYADATVLFSDPVDVETREAL